MQTSYHETARAAFDFRALDFAPICSSEDGLAIPACEAMRLSPLDGIEADGWRVCPMDGYRPYETEWVAVRGEESVLLGVSPRNFYPSQERFAWLVRNNFVGQTKRGGGASSPICNDDIDGWLAAESEGRRSA